MKLGTVRLQLKSMNAVDLDEEFLDVTVFMTFEWIDPNLAWVVKEKELKSKPSVDSENSDLDQPQSEEPESEFPSREKLQEYDPEGK